MRMLGRFSRDRGGLVAADFALVFALVFAGRHLALCHGSQIAAFVGPLFGA